MVLVNYLHLFGIGMHAHTRTHACIHTQTFAHPLARKHSYIHKSIILHSRLVMYFRGVGAFALLKDCTAVADCPIEISVASQCLPELFFYHVFSVHQNKFGI